MSRSAALPAPGYEPPARLIDESGGFVVRFYPEGGGTPHDFDLSGLAAPVPLRRSLAEAFATVTGPAGTRRTQVSAATLLQDVRLFIDVLADARRPPHGGAGDAGASGRVPAALRRQPRPAGLVAQDPVPRRG